MIRSAVLRLSLLYLGIVMAISVGFSVLLYNMASAELQNELNRVSAARRNYWPLALERDFQGFIVNRVEESRNHIKASLIVLNVLTLSAAGGLSYYAARRTLRPIGQALEAQARFASDASHELRTPLAAMQSEIEVTLRDEKVNKAELKEQLTSNLEEIQKLQQLSDGLLRLARQTEDSSAYEPADIMVALEPALDRITKSAKAKAITIKTDIQPVTLTMNAPAITEATYVLLDNAIKYSPENTEVTLSTAANRQRVAIAVSDSGLGIPQDQIPHIFKRFYRIDDSRTKNTTTGYGLGLAIADNIVRQHNGTIRVVSQSDQGTTFTINLPRR